MADYGGDHRRGGVGVIGDASAGPGLHDRRVYIGQLPFAIDSVNKLAELLHDRGIKDHDVLKVPVSPEDGRARGFAFASFTTVAVSGASGLKLAAVASTDAVSWIDRAAQSPNCVSLSAS